MKERYINPFTDFGFKRLFGQEANKDLLIDFLNELLKGKNHIKSLSYKPTEKFSQTEIDRKAIYDLYCENEQGEKFIIELQKAKQNFFKDRTIYYSTFPIQEQAEKGEWNYKLNAVYTVGILDFVFEDEHQKETVVTEVQLMDTQKCKVFYDKLTYIYLQMPNFKKTEEELTTHFERWLYVIRNLSQLMDRPVRLQEKVFSKVFEVAEIAKLTHDEYMAYEDSLKHYRDLKNVIDTAKEEGIQEGIEIGKEQGIEIGKEQGIEIGKEQGIEIGKEQGIEIGEKRGKEQGKVEGIEMGKIQTEAKLINQLLNKGLTVSDITRMLDLSESEINDIIINR